jgi:hypothetical protein
MGVLVIHGTHLGLHHLPVRVDALRQRLETLARAVLIMNIKALLAITMRSLTRTVQAVAISVLLITMSLLVAVQTLLLF